MTKNKSNLPLLIVLLVSFLVTACGGPRINKNYQPPHEINPILVADFDDFRLKLNQLLIRNSQNSWAKDAYWDEYILQIEPLNKSTVVLENIILIDAFGDSVYALNERRELNKASRKNKRKYKKAGYKIKLGAGSTHLNTASVSGALGAGFVAGSVSTTGSIGTLTSTGVGVAVAVPVLVISGVVKMVNNSQVNNVINDRFSALPISIEQGTKQINLFYPATPVPQALHIEYAIDGEIFLAEIDLTGLLTDLHLKPID